VAVDIFALANKLSVLLASRKPEWALQGYTGNLDAPVDLSKSIGVPDSVSRGVYVQDSPRVIGIVDLRHEVHRRRVLIGIEAQDYTATYRITVDGNNVDYNAAAGAPTTLEELKAQWVAAINADPTVGALVTAYEDDPGGYIAEPNKDSSIVLYGRAGDDFSFDAEITVGTADLSVLVDAVSATARLWWHAKQTSAQSPGSGTTPGTWRKSLNGEYAVGIYGFVERFDSGGLDRLYIELVDVAGHPDDGVADGGVSEWAIWTGVAIGPAVDEVAVP